KKVEHGAVRPIFIFSPPCLLCGTCSRGAGSSQQAESAFPAQQSAFRKDTGGAREAYGTTGSYSVQQPAFR
ncbi:unnamed protein product, partial [Ectocarpus fasciculatus]